MKPFVFLPKILVPRKQNSFKNSQRKVTNTTVLTSQLKFHNYSSLDHDHHGSTEFSNQTLMFHVEGALLKSSSVFPYFMLVAFEAGGPLRALILLLLYPFICLVGEEVGIKIMVFVCFLGIQKDKIFNIGRGVLPKFFLEDVGYEGFEMVMMRSGRKVGVSDLPTVMVEGFLKDYLGVEGIMGRELKVVCGYFVGLMEERQKTSNILDSEHVIGISCYNKYSFLQQLPSSCKAVYLVSESEKRNWQALPREKYLKPLIFHDGRLAFRPTPMSTLAMFIWFPFGIFLFMVRLILGILLPFHLSIPIMSLLGKSGVVIVKLNSHQEKYPRKGVLYVCNHRTLLDPIYISMALMKPLTAVTYSLSKITEMFSPLKTIRLTRNREKDSKTMEKLISQGDIVVCPEGTTCREPYLLRFSPLFAEMSDDIVPIAINIKVNMFYGTTASGFKCFDPLFLLMNPNITLHIEVLEKLPRSATCQGGRSKFEVANYVQTQIATTLGFECTSLTRKDKYIVLAVKVGIPEFLNGVGRGVEAHVSKLESEIGDFQKLLVTRSLKLKKLGIPCKQRKLILKYTHKYRLGLWRPQAEPMKS